MYDKGRLQQRQAPSYQLTYPTTTTTPFAGSRGYLLPSPVAASFLLPTNLSQRRQPLLLPTNLSNDDNPFCYLPTYPTTTTTPFAGGRGLSAPQSCGCEFFCYLPTYPTTTTPFATYQPIQQRRRPLLQGAGPVYSPVLWVRVLLLPTNLSNNNDDDPFRRLQGLSAPQSCVWVRVLLLPPWS